MALEAPTAGHVLLEGRDLNALSREELRRARRDFQMVFQDPYGSLDPRQTIERIVAEPLAVLGNSPRSELKARVAEMLESVGLRSADLDKYPHEFSGGQRQRIAIARALLTRPKLIVADEPVSALDVSVQAQVLNLLNDLQARFGVTYLLISHDLAVVDHVCDEVAVMYLGRVVEQGPATELFRKAAHPYTRALLEAVPQPVPRRRAAHPVQAPAAKPERARIGNEGCPFLARCPHAQPRCGQDRPPLRAIAPGHQVACHFAEFDHGLAAVNANYRLIPGDTDPLCCRRPQIMTWPMAHQFVVAGESNHGEKASYGAGRRRGCGVAAGRSRSD